MNRMLSAAVKDGTGHRAHLEGREVAGKTGTSQDFRDGWFIGYSADVIAGVWVGNDDNRPMKKVTGGQLPATIWRDFTARATHGHTARALPRYEAPTAPKAANKRSLLEEITTFFSESVLLGELGRRIRAAQPGKR